MERALILSCGDGLDAADFQLRSEGSTAAAAAPGVPAAPAAPAEDDAADLNLARVEKQTIEQALRRHRFNISHAAKELGLTRAALYRRMEKHGI